ncbi:MAG: hypothetical protein RR942_06245 [Romboutsia sp.]
MSLKKGNRKLYYEIPICFNCLKSVNLKNVISSDTKDNYRYIICDCGQIIKVVKFNNEEYLARIKRNGKEVKEACELFFKNEYSKTRDKSINKDKKTIIDFIIDKNEQVQTRKKDKKKSNLTIIK